MEPDDRHLAAGVVDLDKLRDRKTADGAIPRIPGNTVYVNDCNPCLDTVAGVVTLEFFYKNQNGAYDPTAVSMPVPVFMELANLGPAIAEQITSSIRLARETIQQQAAGGTASSMEEAAAMRDKA